jgi:hypothetical protein
MITGMLVFAVTLGVVVAGCWAMGRAGSRSDDKSGSDLDGDLVDQSTLVAISLTTASEIGCSTSDTSMSSDCSTPTD